MNLHPSNRRQDLPVRLGSHGYRLDGDVAWLNAELHVPPYFSDADFGLELWACSTPCSDGAPSGVKVAEISLELPTPIGPHVHRVEARAPMTPPLGDADHAMVLMLVSRSGETRRIHDFANYADLQHFASPLLDGAAGYALDGERVQLSAASVANPRPEGNASGTLCLELWATAEPYAGGAPRGQRLAGADLGSIAGQYHLPAVTRQTAFVAPAPGRWHMALLLREWTLLDGYVTRDYRNFDVLFDQPAPAASAPTPTSQPVSLQPISQPSAPARAPDKLRLIKPASEANTAPAASATVAAPAATAVVEGAPVAGAAATPVAATPATPAAAAPATPAAETPVAAAPATPVAATPATPAAAAPATPAAATPVAGAPATPVAGAPATPVAAAPATTALPAAASVAAAPSARASTPEAAGPAATVTTPAAAEQGATVAPKASTAIEAGEASAPATALAGKKLVNVQTASVEELAKLPGMTLKIAKEIVKSRPFASLDALVDVRGIGEKTLRKLRSMLTL